jgi:hypothetical protein
MSAELHDLEKRADQHRLEALKKIDALMQESAPTENPTLPDDAVETRPSVEVEKIVIRYDW